MLGAIAVPAVKQGKLWMRAGPCRAKACKLLKENEAVQALKIVLFLLKLQLI